MDRKTRAIFLRGAASMAAVILKLPDHLQDIYEKSALEIIKSPSRITFNSQEKAGAITLSSDLTELSPADADLLKSTLGHLAALIITVDEEE